MAQLIMRMFGREEDLNNLVVYSKDENLVIIKILILKNYLKLILFQVEIYFSQIS